MGAKLHHFLEPPWSRATVLEELEPGEVILAMANFTSTDAPTAQDIRDARLFVLTNRYLRWFGFKLTVYARLGRTDKPRPVNLSYAIAFHQIGSIGEARTGGMLKSERRSMSFTGPTGPEQWWTVYLEGVDVINGLKSKVAGGAPKPIGVADELGKLSALKGEGILSDEEFQRAKELFIGATPDQQTDAMELLRQLHALKRSGVLSEMEFNMKKWDVLARSANSTSHRQ